MGYAYATGYFGDSVDFDPGSGSQILTAEGATDMFIQKLDPSGNLVWVKKIGSDGMFVELPQDIKLDKFSNIHIIGSFTDSVDFDPGPGDHIMYGLVDIFILKLDSSANFKWAKMMGGGNYDMKGADPMQLLLTGKTPY